MKEVAISLTSKLLQSLEQLFQSFDDKYDLILSHYVANTYEAKPC